MRQDIPVEASELLAYTPECLVSLGDEAPVFNLRVGTMRDKRFHRRLHRENGVQMHSPTAIRAELLHGLEALWSAEDFERHTPILKEYWEALDSFELQKRSEPDLVWDYDPDIQAGIEELQRNVAQSWRKLSIMLADNAEYAEMTMPLMVAVMVKSWKNVPTRMVLDRGYFTIDCIEQMQEDLAKVEDKHGVEPGTAWLELFVACSKRLFLDEEEAKNFESPSPSETVPPPSNEMTISDTDGKSPESTALSSPTPESA